MKTIRIWAKLVKIQYDLIFFDFEFIDFWDKVSEEDLLGVFGVLIGKKFFNIIFSDFEVIVLINAVKNKFKDTLIVHKTEDGDSWNEGKIYLWQIIRRRVC